MSTTTRLIGNFGLCGFIALAAYFMSGSAHGAVVGLWRFDEADGDALDSSGNGNAGTFVGSNAFRSASQPGFGSAAEFVNDYTNRSFVDVGASYSLLIGEEAGDPWAITAWGYENSDGFGFINSTYGTMVLQKNTLRAGENYGIALQSGANGDEQHYLWHGTNTAWQIPTGVDPLPNIETWTHYAYVYDGSDFIFYVNGAEEFRQTVGAVDVNYPGYTGAVEIGGTSWFDVSRNWHGKLDDVAMFDQALTPTDLTTIMGGNFAPYIDPLSVPATAEWQKSGFGDWNTTENWIPYVTPHSSDTTAVFGAAAIAPTTVVNEQARTVHGLQFNSVQPYAIAGNGAIAIDSGGAGSGSIAVLNAGGAVTHELQLPVQLSSNTEVTVATDTVLEFDHHLELGGHTLNVVGAGRVNINNNASTGTTGTLNNSATLGGDGTITGDLVNMVTGTLAIDITSDGPLGVHGLTVAGSAALDGMLAIALGDGFSPSSGATFTALTAASMTDNGLMLTGDSAGFSYSVVDGTSLVLTFGAGLAGDYDNDGDVDANDYSVWKGTFGSTTELGADGNGNQVVDAADYTIWRDNLNASGSASAIDSATAVPEPATCMLCLLGGVVWFAGWRRLRPGCHAGLWMLAIAAAIGTAPTASATVLIFSGEYGGNGGSPGEYTAFEDDYTLIDEYGDRVVGLTQSDVASNDFGGTDWYNLFYGEQGEGFTPNVVVNYPAPSTGTLPAYRYWSSYGSFTDAVFPAFGEIGPGTWYMTFTADPGVEVELQSLELDRNTSVSSADVNVSVFEGNDPNSLGAQLYSSGLTTVNPGTPHAFTPNASADALTLVYSFENNANSDAIWHWAIDNVKFRQTGGGLPTSAIWALDGSGRWTDPANWSPEVSPLLIANGNDRTAVLGDATSGPATVVLDDDVTIKKLQFDHSSAYIVAGTGELTFEADSGNASIELLNAGGAVTHQINAAVRLNDDVVASLSSGTTLELNNRVALGAFDFMATGSGTLRVNNVVTSSGGAVSASGGVVAGSGTIVGDLVNNGATVAPGNSPGVLTVQGDYQQSSDGTLQIELAGHERGAQYDVLNVAGNAALGSGVLDVVLLNGFQPRAGDVFDILDFATASGSFDRFILPSGWNWDTSRLAIDGTLTVAGVVPEPASIVLVAMATIALFVRRTNAVGCDDRQRAIRSSPARG